MPICFADLYSTSTNRSPRLFCCASSASRRPPATAQESAPLTAFQKQMNKVDLGIFAAGEGQLHRLRHRAARRQHHPLPAHHQAQFHRRRARDRALHFESLTSASNSTSATSATPRTTPSSPAQSVHPHRAESSPASANSPSATSPTSPYHPFGITPYVGAGGGTIRFKPTPGGGQGLPFQYRAAYYYQAGVEDNFPGSILRHAHRLPSAHLPRPRLPPELPHHHPPHPHHRAHHRLLPPLLTKSGCPIIPAPNGRDDRGVSLCHRHTRPSFWAQLRLSVFAFN